MSNLKLLEFPIDKTRVDRPVTKVLENVLDNLEGIETITCIIKFKDGSESFVSTLPMVKGILWQIEQFKHTILFE